MEPVLGNFIIVPVSGSIGAGLTEGASPITVAIALSDAPTANVTVALADSPDLTGNPASLTFTPANWNVPQQFTFGATDDDLVEGPETVPVTFTSVSTDPRYNFSASENVVITDNDGVVPTISVSDAVIGEGGVATFTVSLSAAITGPVSVNYTTSEGSASVADFISGNDTLNFAAGETSKTVSIQTTQDTLFEGNETFNLFLSAATGGTLADGTGLGVIVNDDLDGPAKIIGRSTNKSDIIQGSLEDDRINSGNGNDTIYGNGGNDRLNGDNGNDRLFGGNGDDRLNGENGNDRIYGDNGDDLIAGGNGNDLLFGGDGNDRINGDNGNDRLFGGDGNDHLRGGAGRDAFVFDSEPNRFTNRDKIVDFNVNNDSVYLDNSVFSELGIRGSLAHPAKLNKAFFTVGSAAKDSNDHVIYDNKKGILLYDADGRGGEVAVEFASVSKNLKMTAGDFFVV